MRAPNIPPVPYIPFSFCSFARRDFVALIIIISVLSCLFASPQNQRAACEPWPSLESAHHFPFSHWSVPFCSVKAESSFVCSLRVLKLYLYILSFLPFETLCLELSLQSLFSCSASISSCVSCDWRVSESW